MVCRDAVLRFSKHGRLGLNQLRTSDSPFYEHQACFLRYQHLLGHRSHVSTRQACPTCPPNTHTKFCSLPGDDSPTPSSPSSTLYLLLFLLSRDGDDGDGISTGHLQTVLTRVAAREPALGTHNSERQPHRGQLGLSRQGIDIAVFVEAS